MTPKTFFTEIRAKLKTLVWTGTSNLIFSNNVYLVTDTPLGSLARYQSPCCFVMDNGASTDDNHPNLILQNFSLMIFVENVNDVWGEGVMLSANQIVNTSQGAGLLDIENEILTQIIKTITLNSVKIQILEKSKAKQARIANNSPNVQRVWSFSCLLSLI